MTQPKGDAAACLALLAKSDRDAKPRRNETTSRNILGLGLEDRVMPYRLSARWVRWESRYGTREVPLDLISIIRSLSAPVHDGITSLAFARR
jgi:hypothetical protein